MMKRLIALLMIFSLAAAGTAVYAEPETDSSYEGNEAQEQAEEENSVETVGAPEYDPSQDEFAEYEYIDEIEPPSEEMSDRFWIEMSIRYHKYTNPSDVAIELYSDDDEYLGMQIQHITWDTDKITMSFDVPEYRMGEHFKVKLAWGLRSIWYYDEMAQIGESIRVETYGYINENGEYVRNDGVYMEGNPMYDKIVHMYITDKWYNEMYPRARIIDGVLMAPVKDVAEAMGLTVKYKPQSNSVTCSIGDKTVEFWVNDEYMTVFGVGKNAPRASVDVEGRLLVPLRALTDAFNCSLEVTDYGEIIDVLVGESPYVDEVRRMAEPVNKRGIGSKTNYLVWVSKSEYKVRVYKGQQYHWTKLKEFPCALGAWNTPTITGQFDYIERTRWDYGSYYVAPVLRFHNGYALHSTLLSYGGGEYDGRVGVNISHGCVRLHPNDINWIANTIPFKTRIYISEY